MPLPITATDWRLPCGPVFNVMVTGPWLPAHVKVKGWSGTGLIWLLVKYTVGVWAAAKAAKTAKSAKNFIVE